MSDTTAKESGSNAAAAAEESENSVVVSRLRRAPRSPSAPENVIPEGVLAQFRNEGGNSISPMARWRSRIAAMRSRPAAKTGK